MALYRHFPRQELCRLTNSQISGTAEKPACPCKKTDFSATNPSTAVRCDIGLGHGVKTGILCADTAVGQRLRINRLPHGVRFPCRRSTQRRIRCCGRIIHQYLSFRRRRFRDSARWKGLGRDTACMHACRSRRMVSAARQAEDRNHQRRRRQTHTDSPKTIAG